LECIGSTDYFLSLHEANDFIPNPSQKIDIMTNILVIGAGRSATALIKYVLSEAAANKWFVMVADADLAMAERKVGKHPNGHATWLDAGNVNDRRNLISRADVVVSLLPAYLHVEVAMDCLRFNKHLITASYLSHDMYKLGEQARDRNLIFMGEMGLDPGIDHMSAMQKINQIKAGGGSIKAFRSYTGGLVAPSSDDNPWHYKISWNPGNVVRAGQGTAQYLDRGRYKYIPYNRLFSQYKVIDIQGMGPYEVYANRDSLLYRSQYGLDDIPTIIRGTIRHRGFCDAWNALVQLGITDDSYPIIDSHRMTYYDLVEAYLPDSAEGRSLRERVADFLGLSTHSEVLDKMEWLGLFSKRKIRLDQATPAFILQQLLLDKWALKPNDCDMIIMQHEFDYQKDGKDETLISTLVLEGENSMDTAMSKLVGLPMGIFVKLIMQGKINTSGVQIPVLEEVYEPVLEELKSFGVRFQESVRG
jgi:saccharopine dehydrogenase (NADP+, L-glutamate forming)